MRDLFSDDHIREWAFEEAETAFSHLLESPAKDRIVYQMAMQFIEDAKNDLDMDKFDDGVQVIFGNWDCWVKWHKLML